LGHGGRYKLINTAQGIERELEERGSSRKTPSATKKNNSLPGTKASRTVNGNPYLRSSRGKGRWRRLPPCASPSSTHSAEQFSLLLNVLFHVSLWCELRIRTRPWDSSGQFPPYKGPTAHTDACCGGGVNLELPSRRNTLPFSGGRTTCSPGTSLQLPVACSWVPHCKSSPPVFTRHLDAGPFPHSSTNDCSEQEREGRTNKNNGTSAVKESGDT
jgi:hypothetical protein